MRRLSSSRLIVVAFSAERPAPDAALDLAVWDQFEQANPHIFSTMCQFWCENE
jgi:hypothetical protein